MKIVLPRRGGFQFPLGEMDCSAGVQRPGLLGSGCLSGPAEDLEGDLPRHLGREDQLDRSCPAFGQEQRLLEDDVLENVGPWSEGFHGGAQDDLNISRRRQHGEVLHAVIGQVRDRIRSEVDFPEMGSRVGGRFPVLAQQRVLVGSYARLAAVMPIASLRGLHPVTLPLEGDGRQVRMPPPIREELAPIQGVTVGVQGAQGPQHHDAPLFATFQRRHHESSPV